MKILHVIDNLRATYGGPGHSVPNQCIYTAKAGLKVGIAFRRDNEALTPEALSLEKRGVEPIPIRGFYPKQLWDAIASYDVIHVNGIWRPFCILGSLYAEMQEKPVVITPHGMLEPWSLQQKKFKKTIGYAAYQGSWLQKAQVLQATATEEASSFRGLGLKPPIALIANGVVIPPLRGPRPLPSNGKRRLLFLSRIHPKKGVLELVRAVGALRQALKRGNWIITLAGPNEGGHQDIAQREAKRLGVEEFLEWPGLVEGKRKWDLYRSADIFILPTFSENFGLVIAEAMGCGTPVLTTQGAPWKELESHRCGWWIPLGQKELETSLKKAIATPKPVLRAMGARGRALVLKSYGWTQIGRQLKKTYEWLDANGQKPDFIL